jgi:hypothetical protein
MRGCGVLYVDNNGDMQDDKRCEYGDSEAALRNDDGLAEILKLRSRMTTGWREILKLRSGMTTGWRRF